MASFNDEMLKFPTISRASILAWTKTHVTRKRMYIAGGIVGGVLILTPIVTYAYYAHDISNRERLMNRNNTGIILRDREGKVFYEFGRVSLNDDVPLSKISDQLEHAAVASEDKDFYTHTGFSPKGIIKAAYADVSNGSATKYGGSTITQQLVKNKLLSSNKNFFRKYQEVAMAIAVERRYTKAEILDMYLNSVYFGEGAFGISDAAKTYFNKKPADLTLAESSLLVGLLPAPSAYSPLSGNRELAKKAQAEVLNRMQENGYITTTQRMAAFSENLSYAPAAKNDQTYAQHYAMMVVGELKDKYGEERVTRSGFDVTTALDSDWQKKAEQIIEDRVAIMRSQGGRNASLVAMDPRTGEVKALVGSVDWDNPQFGQVNMATTLRQPGSSFKPIYYSKAIDEHLITAATILDDKRTTFGGTYTPDNFDHIYKGKMSVRSALAQSRNVPAVQVVQKLGVSNAAKSAQEMGLRSVNQPQKYGLTLAVGTAEVELTNMTNAYAAFADGGDLHQQILIKEVQDKGGKRIFKAKDQKHRVRSQQASFIVSSILSDNAARAPLYGSALNLSGRPAAVKTGTTNDNVDAWTIGYTPQAVVGVWVGNNEHEAMVGLAGGSAAGVIWRQTMTEYLRSEPVIRFETPKNIVQISVCRGSGARASSSGGNTYSEYFIQGTEPTATCNATQQPKETPKKKHDDKKADDEKKKDDKKDAGQEPPEPTEPEPDNPPEDPTDPTDPDDPDDPGTPPPVQ
jgi:1A family penicillin-binding protein